MTGSGSARARFACVVFVAGMFCGTSHSVMAMQASAAPTSGIVSQAQIQADKKKARADERLARKDEKLARIEESKARVEDRAVEEFAAEDNGVNVYRHSPMVHTFARVLGLSVETTARIFEWLNFLILAIAVLWFVMRALPKALRSRAERIQKNLQEARLATEDANRRLQDVEQRLARLDTEIDSLKSQAERETVADEARIRASMEEEQQRLVRAAEQEIASVGANAQRRLKTLAADLILEYATHHVSLDADEDRFLVRSFVSDLGGTSRSAGRN